MDIDDDGVSDPTAEFGELFEGQVAFESELGDHDADEMLGSIGSEIHHLGSSHHPSDHDILDGNLPFVPDDYLQHQNMGEGSEFGGMELEEGINLEGESQYRSGGIGTEAISNNFNQVPVTDLDGRGDGPKVKKKVKVVKNVEHFTREHLDSYLKRRGFKMNGSDISSTKSISKAVFALNGQNNSQKSHPKLVSFGSRYDAEFVVQEMERFWKFYTWTKTNNTAISQELLPMLIPTFLHFFFEAMLFNLQTIARRICFEFGKKFLNENKTQEHYDLLVAAMKTSSPEVLKSDSVLSPLLNRRCEFEISELTLLHLRKFLSKSTNSVLPNLFTSRFKIRAKEAKELISDFDWDMEGCDADGVETIDLDNCEGGEDVSNTREHLKYVQSVIDDVRNSVSANLPSVSVYTTSDQPICGAVSKQGSMVAFGLAVAGMRLYSIEDAKDIMNMPTPPKDLSDPEAYYGAKNFCGHAGTVYGVHFHPRTKLLFSVGQDSLMRVWDLNAADKPGCKAVYRGHSGPIFKLDIPDSGSMIATAGIDSTARIFLPERTEFVRIMAGHYFGVNAVKFHPNEAYIATGSADKSARLWSVNDGKMVRMFTGIAGTLNCLAFHSSGKYLAGAGEDKKILIWDLAQGEILATLDCLKNCKDLLFSGNTLSACYQNGMIQMFNLRPILGGCQSNFESDTQSISSPYTTRTNAKALFRLYYKNPGELFCLGSNIVEDEEVLAKQKEKEAEAEAANKSSEKEATPTSEATNSTNATLLQQVLVLQTTTPTATTTSNPPKGNSNKPNSSKILASRLSQPSSSSSMGMEEDITSMILSESEDIPSVSTSVTGTTGSAPMISSSELDAAIASVIDQSGGDHHPPPSTGGAGTITMYASL